LELSDLTQPVVPVYVNGITTIVAASAAAWVGKRAAKPRKHEHKHIEGCCRRHRHRHAH
jgi:hypothetical protein